MIIKSIGRKARQHKNGHMNYAHTFTKLVRYMTRADHGQDHDHDEHCEPVLWHGFYGHSGMQEADLIAEFQRNAERLHLRKNGNVLYHEILSFSRGHTLSPEDLDHAVTDIGSEYLKMRAPMQLAFGAIHRDTEHIHLHLMVSANAIGKKEREWYTKKQFADLQKATEAYVLSRHPELVQSKIYDKTRQKEQLKTQSQEQAMKSRTGQASRKEDLKQKLHGLFELAKDEAELKTLLIAENIHFYQRGKTIGIIVKEADGKERKHRLETLGLLPHYEATKARLHAKPHAKETKPNHEKSEPEMNRPFQQGADAWGERTPSAMEIVEYELLTGKLHEQWHGKQDKDGSESPNQTTQNKDFQAQPAKYHDDLLDLIQKNKDKAEEIQNASTSNNTEQERRLDELRQARAQGRGYDEQGQDHGHER